MVEYALIAQVLLWVIVLGTFLMSGQASLFHPVTVYLLFHGLVFVVRPILVVLFGFDAVWNYMIFAPTPEDLVRSMAVSSLALVVLCSTCLAFGWCRVGDYSAQPRSFTQLERNSLILTTLLLTPIILYSVHVVGSGQATGKMVGATYIMTGTTGYINDAQVMGGALICTWLVFSRFRWPVVMAAAIYVMYRSYQGWARWTILLFFWQPPWSMPGSISAGGCRSGPSCS